MCVAAYYVVNQQSSILFLVSADGIYWSFSSKLCTIRTKLYASIYPGYIYILFITPRHIIKPNPSMKRKVFSAHSFSGVSSPNVMYFYSTSKHMVCIVHLEYCVLNTYTAWSTLHTHYVCAFDTTVNTVQTRLGYLHKIQCAMH